MKYRIHDTRDFSTYEISDINEARDAVDRLTVELCEEHRCAIMVGCAICEKIEGKSIDPFLNH